MKAALTAGFSVKPGNRPARRSKWSAARAVNRLEAEIQTLSPDQMKKPLIFSIAATWDDDASVWTGVCDAIPAAADAPTINGVLEKITAMTLDILPGNHPGADPSSVFLRITALREAEHLAD
jgi:hypothetical protein